MNVLHRENASDQRAGRTWLTAQRRRDRLAGHGPQHRRHVAGWARFVAGSALCLSLLLAGCVEEPDYLYGDLFVDDLLVLMSTDVGVYPDESVLVDPNNPFAVSRPTAEVKWDIQSRMKPVPAFYAWATLLALDPNGEAQFYTAVNLREVYRFGLASQEDLEVVRALSIRGFQAVLDHFPDAVTYDETGTIAWDLATPSVMAIHELGGSVEGDWILVTDAGGALKAVQR